VHLQLKNHQVVVAVAVDSVAVDLHPQQGWWYYQPQQFQQPLQLPDLQVKVALTRLMK
jgi:hypothetical protein